MSAYDFLKGLGEKIPQKVLETEYNRRYRNLKRSVYGYFKRGITTSFFKLPKKPKKITQASMRKLEKSITEWKYYTAQKLTKEEYEMLPTDITRSFQRNISEASRRANKLSKVSKDVDEAIKQYRKDLEDRLKENNKDNEDYQKMKDEGYDGNLPSTIANEAINLYRMAQYAYQEASAALAKGDHSRNWWFIQLKAETSLSAFDNVGLVEFASFFSFHLSFLNKHKIRAYSNIVDTFDTALYDSEQLDYKNRFSDIMNCIIQQPKNMSAREREEYDEIKEALGLT